MAVWVKRGRHVYLYDFTLNGQRFYGSTGKTSPGEAAAIEDQKRREAAVGLLAPSGAARPVPEAVRHAWEASVEVVAAAYGVEAELLRWQSRGRGPRPPKKTWEARKMAVHLAVIVSGCDYALVAQLAGLHRDTVASHAAEMRDGCAESDDLERMSLAVEHIANTRMRLSSLKATALRSAA